MTAKGLIVCLCVGFFFGGGGGEGGIVFCPFVQCCFTSTETRRFIRDGKPRTATSTFTQLLSSDFLLVFV